MGHKIGRIRDLHLNITGKILVGANRHSSERTMGDDRGRPLSYVAQWRMGPRRVALIAGRQDKQLQYFLGRNILRETSSIPYFWGKMTRLSARFPPSNTSHFPVYWFSFPFQLPWCSVLENKELNSIAVPKVSCLEHFTVGTSPHESATLVSTMVTHSVCCAGHYIVIK